MPQVKLSREAIKEVLGAGFCSENSEGDEVCVYVNARSDGKLYVKVTVNGDKVAYTVAKPKDIVALVAPAVLAARLRKEDIEALWAAAKGQGREKRGRGERREKRKERGGEEEEESNEEEVELL